MIGAKIGIYAAQVGLDPDAQSFIDAAGVLINKYAYNNLVLNLKGIGTQPNAVDTWSDLDYINPLPVDSLGSCLFNLKDPSTFLGSTGGVLTHSTTGVTGSTNGYIDAGLLVDSMDINSSTIGMWTDGALVNNAPDIGVYNGGAGLSIFPHQTGGGNLSRNFNATAFGTTIANKTGTYINTRTASNLTTIYKDGASIATSILTPTSITSGSSILMFCREFNGIPFNFSTRKCKFFFRGSGLSASQAENLDYAIVIFRAEVESGNTYTDYATARTYLGY